jgi:sugar phosphate isomerase/epimerase
VAPAPRLTYCGNVHAAEDLEHWFEAATTFTVPIAERQRRHGRVFGLGVHWNAAVMLSLARSASARERVRRFLTAHELEVWTFNVFPHGSFHRERVKERVYQPDWADEARVAYTLAAAAVAGELAAPGAPIALSTLPLGWRTGDREAMARNLARVGSELARLADSTGRDLVLALEPEPCCLLETVAATASFLEEFVFPRDGSGDVLRNRLGVCVDLCHLAVVDEDPLRAIADLRRRGIRVPKIQVSSCLELRDPVHGLEQLLAFDEPRYLHQTIASTGARAEDLPDVRMRWAEFAVPGRIRTHFHVPVFWDASGPLGSTRTELQRVLPELPREVPLEVETYTWDVLDPSWRPARDLARGIDAELCFVRESLGRAP